MNPLASATSTHMAVQPYPWSDDAADDPSHSPRLWCKGRPRTLKRGAAEQIHTTRFKFLSLRMSLSQNCCALLGDMHQEQAYEWTTIC
ncbi:hypothetical protein MESS4_560086 [Mesorhizobium sp. STM 4661]|nr:hypothetical protein MESS4_560086 [Mesorhizobium sp. STM 4661]